MEIKNIRNFEILNEKPKVLYAEADYVGGTELQNIYGFVYEINNEKSKCIQCKCKFKVKRNI